MIIDARHLNDPTLVRATGTGHARLGFSQLGEDAVLWHLFSEKRDGFYVDIGCHHPFRFSDTAIFSSFYNWSGLNVDVDQDLISEFNVERPRDCNVCAAIGLKRGTAELTLFHESAVNSLDPDTILEYKRHFEPKATRTVDVYPLKDVLELYLKPDRTIDLLTVDVEGLDFDVLASNDWTKWRPSVVAVEAHNFDLSILGLTRRFASSQVMAIS